MASKTFKVNDLRDKINTYLRMGISQDEKKALSVMLETILMETGNYAGFSYQFDWSTADDETKAAREYDRHYYMHKNLTAGR